MQIVNFKLSRPIPTEVFTEVCYKLHFASKEVDSFRIDPQDRQTVTAHIRGAKESVKAKMERVAMQAMQDARTVSSSGKHKGPAVQFGRPVQRTSPWSSLERSQELVEFSQGICATGGVLLGHASWIDSRVLTLADSEGAVQYNYPCLVPVSLLERIGYLDEFPQHLFFATHVLNDVDEIETYKQRRRTSSAKGDEHCFAPMDLALQPAVCFHVYQQFAGQTLTRPVVITCSGPCFRYEAGNAYKLERLWCFTLRELVFLGDKDYVLRARERCVDWAVQLADELGLQGEVTSSSDPFFMKSDRDTNAMYGLDGVESKFELRVHPPYRKGTIALASFNVHGTFFAERFQLSSRDGLAWTACVGFGLERWALMLAAYGRVAGEGGSCRA